MSGNKNIVLVMGKPATGKSASLMNLPQESMVYLNTDLKELPFRDRFKVNQEVALATSMGSYIAEIEKQPDVTGAVLDTLTFLMSMYQRQVVANAVNTMKAWGEYGDFYRNLIHAIKSGSKNYAIMAHEESFLNEQTAQYESRVPVAGSVGKTGVEADFTTVVSTKQMPIKKLESFENDLLTITDAEREDGVKYVFQTRITKETAGEKMRSAMGLWDRSELYIDNDLNQVFERLNTFYGSTPIRRVA